MDYENNQSDKYYINRAGKYLCRVKPPGQGWYGEQGDKNTPFIRIPLTVDDSASDQDGMEIVWRGWITPGAFDYTIKTLAKAFPVWDGDLQSLDEGKFSFVGMECEITCESETYNGKTRIVVKWLNPVGGGSGKAMDRGKVQGLIAQLGRKSIALAKAAKEEEGSEPKQDREQHREQHREPRGTETRTNQPPLEDDDIPF
jgi:hypothetical protein